MKQRQHQRPGHQLSLGRKLGLGILVITLLPLILYALFVLQRPPRLNLTQTLFAGVTYDRQVLTTPRPIVIHTVSVDLSTPGIRVIVSPGASNRASNAAEPSGETIARTTTEFLAQAQVQIAVNGSFFYPFHERTPWDYGPHSGDRANVLGQAIAAGIPYAQPRDNWHPLCLLDTQTVVISTQTTCPATAEFALSGGPLLLINGQVTRSQASNASKPYARMIVATNATGTQLWLIAVDGKQPFYSEGMTMAEITEWVQALGATDALSLDGGGSTTLVQSTSRGPKVLNAPIQTKWPMRERPVANHLGIYAQSLE